MKNNGGFTCPNSGDDHDSRGATMYYSKGSLNFVCTKSECNTNGHYTIHKFKKMVKRNIVKMSLLLLLKNLLNMMKV